uniref:Uncharacterized protein n=1 Tax=Helicotheca tamesis TaxID=374047 RepID=A0A7S2MU68_9STRA|eukprot:CAMPEP_0185723690 /NCGR_PEP_ID=MMETSP1171-20130828/445_1 /TAXON_ID=374046 /ORGANISM="Helicotheca tamensis, Strain CCMP826" /LENGTH=444 /DNA_ID=CAMNT_0028391429 /DNA_START=142 /DNA_END=1476 /DNA_ORIENTATION=+
MPHSPIIGDNTRYPQQGDTCLHEIPNTPESVLVADGKSANNANAAIGKMNDVSHPPTATNLYRRKTGSNGFKELFSEDISNRGEGLTEDAVTTSKPPHDYPFHVNVLILLFSTFTTMEFALWFPYIMAPHAATATYIPASYSYDEMHTHFDNTAWTYITDYILAVIMFYGAYRCLTAVAHGNYWSSDISLENDPSARIRKLSFCLFFCYTVSVLSGGWAHQRYKTTDALNTSEFRVLWTVCVGTVTAAGGFMGAIGSEVVRSFRPKHRGGEIMLSIPSFPDWFWAGYGIYMTVVCARGGISFKRPACDIFIAGTTQFVPTVYCIAVVFCRKWRDDLYEKGNSSSETSISRCKSFATGLPAAIKFKFASMRKKYRVVYYVGFCLNCPLLPMYPLLVQYTSMSLGTVNTFLHAWLMFGWGMQVVSLHHMSLALSTYNETAFSIAST